MRMPVQIPSGVSFTTLQTAAERATESLRGYLEDHQRWSVRLQESFQLIAGVTAEARIGDALEGDYLSRDPRRKACYSS